jgi:hypothetical protein
MSKSKAKTEEKKIKSKDKGPTLKGLRENSSQSFKDVIKDLGTNEFFTKADMKKKYNKFVTAVVPQEDFNYMSDLIEMPTTKSGFKWILVVLDLATNVFDIEPMQNKEATTTLNAFKKIVKRGILILPEISIKTDGGTEFKGAFDKYLTEHKIMHKTAKAYRKQQMGPVEGLNTTIARLLMNYLNDKSMELDKDYSNWDDILDMVREEVNQYRVRDLGKLKQYQDAHYFDPEEAGDPEFNIGQYVHYKVDRPIDIRGNPINDGKFRQGDRIFSLETRQIVDILCYPSEPHYRYKLHDMVNVSYSASELKLSKQKDDYYILRKIIGVKTVAKKKFYLCWWKGELKADATWEAVDKLLEDGLADEIAEFEKESRKRDRKI